VPVLTSRGGGTESSKLKSGRVEVAVEVAVDLVVDRGGGLVAEDAVRGGAVETLLVETLVVVGFRGVAVRSEALHALRVTMPATRTLLARFPTRRTLGNTDARAAIGSSNRKFESEVRGEREEASVMSGFSQVRACAKAAPGRELVEGPGTFV
jgi:hypothetical protein